MATNGKLYSLSPLLMLMPLMLKVDQIGPFLRGSEFRALVAQWLDVIVSSFANTVVTAVVELWFGGLSL
jgi:hypothetical protein